MGITLPNLGLHVWSAPTDPYSSTQLASNFYRIDEHDHSPGKGRRIIATSLVNYSLTDLQLADNAVVNRTIAPSAVDTGKLANLSVTTPKLADTSVTGAKMAPFTITTGQMGANSVGTANLLDANVTKIKLATDALNAFLKLLTPVHLRLAYGVVPGGAFSFADMGSPTSVPIVVAHGLGVVPSWFFFYPMTTGHNTATGLPFVTPGVSSDATAIHGTIQDSEGAVMTNYVGGSGVNAAPTVLWVAAG